LADDYKKEFTITSDSKEHNAEVKEYLNTKFQKSKIHTQLYSDKQEVETEALRVSIS
jgi:uncharacterized protein YpmS